LNITRKEQGDDKSRDKLGNYICGKINNMRNYKNKIETKTKQNRAASILEKAGRQIIVWNKGVPVQIDWLINYRFLPKLISSAKRSTKKVAMLC
jgi:hypothetical protein